MDVLTAEEFLEAARLFVEISEKVCDDWKLYEDKKDCHKSFLKKESFISNQHGVEHNLLKGEYVVFYNFSYGVPSFSFNIWNASGVLLSLEEIRQMSFVKINQKDFYSVITQQEHPVFCRPYFIVHPCHTSELLAMFRNRSKNIIVTFLGLITPLIKLDLPLEYGL